MNKKITYLKIFGVLAVSYLIINIFAKEVFIANTPKIRPNLDRYIASKLNSNIQFLAGLINKRTPEEELKDIPLKMVTKGIYAKDKDNVSQTVIKLNEVEFVEYTFNTSKGPIKIKVPKGQNPPPQGAFE
ncbi:MAG: hypothetical protein HYW86_01055 [Candidatus Roizmanbacteria bacterium]|nr:MAG: hypothetical protein HYW86_01055 [Candidatus Roizmanbacteria bacterium]